MPKVVTTESYIEECNKVHNSIYDYTSTIYINAHSKVNIICKIHGEFTQLATDHKSGKGCQLCANSRTSSSMLERRKTDRVTIDEFVARANSLHNTKFDYSKVKFIYTTDTIVIVCPVHGDINIRVTKHLMGTGCKKCLDYRNGWSYSEWENSAMTSKEFDSFKLYVLKVWNKEESFYKIGKTFKTIGRRFRSSYNMPYEYSIIKTIEGSALYISKLESELHSINKNNKYIPHIAFSGMNECYSNITINGELHG